MQACHTFQNRCGRAAALLRKTFHRISGCCCCSLQRNNKMSTILPHLPSPERMLGVPLLTASDPENRWSLAAFLFSLSQPHFESQHLPITSDTSAISRFLLHRLFYCIFSASRIPKSLVDIMIFLHCFKKWLLCSGPWG
jgi:hypothetical protein